MNTVHNDNSKIKLSFVVPYYNEEEIIKQSIREILRQLSNQFPDSSYELLLVNDNSNDHSSEIVKEFGSLPYVHLVNFPTGPSHRENMAKAMKQAKGDIICFFDIDLSCDITYLKNLIDAIEIEGFDLAIGNRYHRMSILDRSLGRKLISLVYNPLIRILWGSKLSDHQCGFKAFKESIFTVLWDEMGFDSPFTRGWFWDTELLLRAQKKSYKIKEIPVKWKNRFHEKTWLFFIKNEFRFIFYILRNYKKLK